MCPCVTSGPCLADRDGGRRAADGLRTGTTGRGDAPQQRQLQARALPHSGSELRKGTSPLQFRQTFTSRGGVVTAQAYGISPGAKGGTAQLVGVMGNGSLKSLGYAKLNASGTATSVIQVRQVPGRQLTLLWRITPARGAGAEAVSGPPTTITVR